MNVKKSFLIIVSIFAYFIFNCCQRDTYQPSSNAYLDAIRDTTTNCYDYLQNQGETGIDYGGPCDSCYNNKQDSGEHGIDCGGICRPCPTCIDGIKNQGETEPDCGGPCEPCKGEWVKQESGVNVTLNSVHFVNETVGFVVGGDATFLRTFNGGESWEQVDVIDGYTFYSTFFTSEQNGFIIGRNSSYNTGTGASIVLKTEDSGDTWTHTILPDIALNDLFFTDELNGYCLDYHSIFKTENGGQSWEKIHITDKTLYKIHFINSNIGFAIGNYNVDVLKTTDGGRTWNEVSIDKPLGSLYDIFFRTDKIGYFTGHSGQIFKTEDGGDSWVDFSYMQSTYDRIYFTSTDTGYLLISPNSSNFKFSVYKTEDGGLIWNKYNLFNETVENYNDGCKDWSGFANIIYAVGYSGSIFKMID